MRCWSKPINNFVRSSVTRCNSGVLFRASSRKYHDNPHSPCRPASQWLATCGASTLPDANPQYDFVVSVHETFPENMLEVMMGEKVTDRQFVN